VSNTRRPYQFSGQADAQGVAVLEVPEAKPLRFRGDRDEPKVPVTLSLNEADALLTGSEQAILRHVQSSRAARRRSDDFGAAADSLREAAKIAQRVGEIALQVDTATRSDRY
jgi:hypothetical protein